jgi:hypothetical protein
VNLTTSLDVANVVVVVVVLAVRGACPNELKRYKNPVMLMSKELAGDCMCRLHVQIASLNDGRPPGRHEFEVLGF